MLPPPASPGGGNPGLTRKHAAILYADVAGYSRLTGDDEEGTHLSLKVHLRILADAIFAHGGRVCHYAGDAVLAEFANATSALRCAVEAQRELAKRNGRLPKLRRLEFRIGINTGYVIVDGHEIYGNAVNLAARLETLAEPGSICISAHVLDEVVGKLDVGLVAHGLQLVKNIEKPIDAWRVLLDDKVARTDLGHDEPSGNASRWRLLFLAALGFAGIHATKPRLRSSQPSRLRPVDLSASLSMSH